MTKSFQSVIYHNKEDQEGESIGDIIDDRLLFKNFYVNILNCVRF